MDFAHLQAIVVGSDIPDLSAEVMLQASTALDAHEVSRNMIDTVRLQ